MVARLHSGHVLGPHGGAGRVTPSRFLPGGADTFGSPGGPAAADEWNRLARCEHRGHLRPEHASMVGGDAAVINRLGAVAFGMPHERLEVGAAGRIEVDVINDAPAQPRVPDPEPGGEGLAIRLVVG